jgi:phosphoribosylformylglycinamidine synthase
MPISHGEGKYYADPETLPRLKQQNLIVFRYAEADGRVTRKSNPNGSLDNIAGIVNPEGTVAATTDPASTEVLTTSASVNADRLLMFSPSSEASSRMAASSR